LSTKVLFGVEYFIYFTFLIQKGECANESFIYHATPKRNAIEIDICWKPDRANFIKDFLDRI